MNLNHTLMIYINKHITWCNNYTQEKASHCLVQKRLIILPILILLAIKLMPDEILINARTLATKEIKLNKKFGYNATVIVILIWILMLMLIFFQFKSVFL